ncbi:MAG: hypothetical protein K0V04_16115 [Deltaproteobacteria bacterium]|nr:hypothetical protein [Deltaproteobacteria bacterium]
MEDCVNDIVLLGRSCAPRRFPGVRVFSVLSPDGTVADLQQPTRIVNSWTDDCGRGERLWLVASSVREVIRTSIVPVPPLTGNEMEDAPAVGRSALRLRIIAGQRGGSSTYLVDLGQSLELYAESLQVELLAPTDAQLSSDAENRRGLLADTQAVARLLQIEQSRGARTALLSQTFFIRETSGLVVEIPPAARALTLYPSNPAVALPGSWTRGDPASGGVALGDVFVPANGRRYASVAPSATHLSLDAVAEDRVVTFVWEIAP